MPCTMYPASRRRPHRQSINRYTKWHAFRSPSALRALSVTSPENPRSPRVSRATRPPVRRDARTPSREYISASFPSRAASNATSPRARDVRMRELFSGWRIAIRAPRAASRPRIRAEYATSLSRARASTRTFSEQELDEITPILTGDTGDEGHLARAIAVGEIGAHLPRLVLDRRRVHLASRGHRNAHGACACACARAGACACAEKKERARAGVWRAASCREASRRGGRGEATERRGRGVNRLVCVMGVCGRPLWREGVGRG